MDKILSREEIHHRILQEKILQLRDSLHHLLEDIFKAYHMEEVKSLSPSPLQLSSSFFLL